MDETQAVQQPTENPNVVQQREHIRKLETALREKDAELSTVKETLTAKERAELAEVDRLKAENADLANKTKVVSDLELRIQAQDAKFASLYEKELATIPAEQQSAITAITSQIATPEGRYDALLNLKSLTVTAKPTGGTVTNPATPGLVPNPTNPPAPVSPKDWGSKNFLQAASESLAAKSKV
jgi:hypothetical protein